MAVGQRRLHADLCRRHPDASTSIHRNGYQLDVTSWGRACDAVAGACHGAEHGRQGRMSREVVGQCQGRSPMKTPRLVLRRNSADGQSPRPVKQPIQDANGNWKSAF